MLGHNHVSPDVKLMAPPCEFDGVDEPLANAVTGKKRLPSEARIRQRMGVPRIIVSTARLALLLVASNALVSFMIYRSRNQLVGLVGFQILMGIGLAETHTAILPRLRRWTVPVVTGAFVLIVLITGGQMRRTRLTLASEAALGLSSDPCAVIHDTDRFDPELIRRLKAHYEMANPGCVHRP